MAKAPSRSYDLAEIIEAERGRNHAIEIIAGDVTLSIDPPILWPDKVFEVSDQRGARILLGDQYDAFVAAGGTARLLFDIVKRSQGATVPE